MDWINPDTWKLPATLIGDWQAILVGVVAIGGAIGGLIRWGLKPFRWAASKLLSLRSSKRIALTFVHDDLRCRWSHAMNGNNAGTHLHGHWHVTNTSEGNVAILKARLPNHATDYVNVFTRHPAKNMYARYPALSHQMSEVSADFTFFPPICRDREALINDVIFTDNFGVGHRVRSVRFTCVGP